MRPLRELQTINGPDVHVYLANNLDAKDYVDLGSIKGTEGNINYEVPAGIDIDKYRYALHWCEKFSVLFNSADLSTVR
ncbi:MAG: DM13 domain-containing protein [Candidatus Moraniibacteriota bacterium]